MDRGCALLSVLVVSVLCGCSGQSLADSKRLFSIAVNRVTNLHLLAERIFNDFQSSLQIEEQRQMNKMQDFCNSDDIISPIDKHATQLSSVMKLLTICYRLIEFWEFPNRAMAAGPALRYQITPKITELKTGIELLIAVTQEAGETLPELDSSHISPGSFYHSLGGEQDYQRRSYKLLSCFKKDMHKVETYLTVAKCRLFPEANCTL